MRTRKIPPTTESSGGEVPLIPPVHGGKQVPSRAWKVCLGMPSGPQCMETCTLAVALNSASTGGPGAAWCLWIRPVPAGKYFVSGVVGSLLGVFSRWWSPGGFLVVYRRSLASWDLLVASRWFLP